MGKLKRTVFVTSISCLSVHKDICAEHSNDFAVFREIESSNLFGHRRVHRVSGGLDEIPA